MRVHWTDTALSHLRSIHAYIGQSSPEYALRIVDRLTRRSQQIGAFPQSGRIVPEVELPQIREVLEGPYRVIYHRYTEERLAKRLMTFPVSVG